jgi:hypothetical protein
MDARIHGSVRSARYRDASVRYIAREVVELQNIGKNSISLPYSKSAVRFMREIVSIRFCKINIVSERGGREKSLEN